MSGNLFAMTHADLRSLVRPRSAHGKIGSKCALMRRAILFSVVVKNFLITDLSRPHLGWDTHRYDNVDKGLIVTRNCKFNLASFCILT